jgi:hypothetical protein
MARRNNHSSMAVVDSEPVVADAQPPGPRTIPLGKPVPWEAGYGSTAVFWCLNTADATGPDDGFVRPHACVATRACFCEREANPITRGTLE